MDEILFRGKRVDNKKCVYGNYVADGSGYHFITQPLIERHQLIAVIPETVGQYTGMTDNNAVKIFKSDIVKIIVDDEIGIVSWCNDELEWVLTVGNIDYKLGNFYSAELEIVGNIYDNPELLEVEQSE